MIINIVNIAKLNKNRLRIENFKCSTVKHQAQKNIIQTPI